MVGNKICEAFKNGLPNEQMPLGWAQTLVYIAFSKLSPAMQKAVSK